MRMYAQLTTAEARVLEVLVAHKALGAPHSTFEGRSWVKPQLETLRENGFIDWTFDEDANFRVTSIAQLMSSLEATAIADRFRRADCTPSTPGHVTIQDASPARSS